MTSIALVYFSLILLAAAATDLAAWRIPNALPALLALGAVTLGFPHGVDEALSRGAAFAVVTAVGLALWLRRGLGGGDVKLLSAAALWTPLSTLPVFVLVLALAGGIQAAAVLAQARLAPAGASAPGRRRMPYAVSIAAAGLAWAAVRAGLIR